MSTLLHKNNCFSIEEQFLISQGCVLNVSVDRLSGICKFRFTLFLIDFYRVFSAFLKEFKTFWQGCVFNEPGERFIGMTDFDIAQQTLT